MEAIEEPIEIEEEEIQPPPPPPPKPRLKAKWLPFGNVMAPKVLDGSLAGDVGFDPLGLSKSKKTLFWMREAEVKHARLAMLAAVGWPLSELWHQELGQAFGFPSILAANDKAPSLLNGGLASPFVAGTLITSILMAGLLEGKSMNDGTVFWNADKPDNYVPGDLKFDPLNLHRIRGDRKVMQTMEIKNGRLAMLAITAYAFSEAFTGMPVTEQTPFLFYFGAIPGATS